VWGLARVWGKGLRVLGFRVEGSVLRLAGLVYRF
jgi:hypothetical protein